MYINGGEHLRQGDGTWTGSDIPWRGGGVIGVDDTINLVGGPATAFLSGADGYADFAGGGGGGGCRCGDTPGHSC